MLAITTPCLEAGWTRLSGSETNVTSGSHAVVTTGLSTGWSGICNMVPVSGITTRNWSMGALRLFHHSMVFVRLVHYLFRRRGHARLLMAMGLPDALHATRMHGAAVGVLTI